MVPLTIISTATITLLCLMYFSEAARDDSMNLLCTTNNNRCCRLCTDSNPPKKDEKKEEKPPTVEILPLCPANTKSRKRFVRHETNCSAYYACDGVILSLEKCTQGDMFNIEMEICDIPINVDCTGQDHYL